MTTPGGAANVTIPDNLPAILFPKSVGTGSLTPLSGAAGLTRDAVEAALKQQKVVDNPAINNPMGAVFDGLRMAAGLPIAILEAIGQQIAQDIDATVDNVTAALAWIGDILSGKWLGIDNAGSAAATANTGVQALKSRIEAGGIPGGGGVYFTDGFAYATAALLPNPPYVSTGYGAGAGTYGPRKSTSGSSSSADTNLLVWKPSGSADRTTLAINTVNTLSTDNGVVSGVFVKKPGSNAYSYLIGRDDGAGGTHVRGAVSDSVVAIEVVSAGNTFTTVDSVSVTVSDGDVFEFWYGTQVDATLLWLVQNGEVIIDPIAETTHTIGSGNRNWGVGGKAKGLGGFSGQSAPANLGSVTASDQGT